MLCGQLQECKYAASTHILWFYRQGGYGTSLCTEAVRRSLLPQMHTSPANHPSTSGLQTWPNELFLPLRLRSTRTPSNVRKQIEYNKERACKVLLFAALYLICKSNKMSELHYTEEKKCPQCQSCTWDPFSSVYLMYLFYLGSLFLHLQKETKWKKVSCHSFQRMF